MHRVPVRHTNPSRWQRGHWGRFTSLWSLEDVVSSAGSEKRSVLLLACLPSSAICNRPTGVLFKKPNCQMIKLRWGWVGDRKEKKKKKKKLKEVQSERNVNALKRIADKEPIKSRIMVWNCTWKAASPATRYMKSSQSHQHCSLLIYCKLTILCTFYSRASAG